MEPFTTEAHAALRQRARAFASGLNGEEADGPAMVRALAAAGMLSVCAPAIRTSALELVILREELAAASAFVDVLVGVQALAAIPIALAGDPAARGRWLPGLASGTEIGAFALTEAAAGSDAAALETTATRDGPGYRLTGEKVLISNAGIATTYVVFARTGAAEASRPLSAFVVPAGAAGLSIEATTLMAPHPIGTVRFDGVRVDAGARLGEEGDGLRLAMTTLGVMRPTVGAAACGLAGRALEEARRFVSARRTFGKPLAERDSVQMALAEMATSLEAARLLVYRAAWLRDREGSAGARLVESSMAKLFATEAAQQIVDRALQLHGGLGVVRGVVVERLYREVRALRIYEGTSEIQKLIIARALLGDG